MIEEKTKISEKETKISEKDYQVLLLKFLEGQTMTTDELQKILKYEADLKADSVNNDQLGKARSLSTPAGRMMSKDTEKQDSGLVSSILIIFGAIALGIATAYVVFSIST